MGEQFAAFWSFLELFEAICSYLELFEANMIYLELFRDWKLFGGIWGLLEPFRAI